MLSKEKMSVLVAEFVGAAMLASVVLVVSNMFGGGTAAWYTAITVGVALSLIMGLFASVSGAHVNPAVTVGMWTQKKIESSTAVTYIIAQLAGGAIALSFFNYTTGTDLFASGSSVFSWNVFVAEAVGAAIFGMGIAAVMSQKLQGYYAAVTTGLSFAMGMLIATVASAGFINPAVALGNNAWDRTLVVAPVLGVVVGMHIYLTYVAPGKKRK